MISRGEFKALLKHPTRDNQSIFILGIDDYTWVVPFVLDDEVTNLFLKTAFPSRPFHARYGESDESTEA